MVQGVGETTKEGSILQIKSENSQADGYFYLFIITEEFNPLSGKVIRRVITNPRLAQEMSKEFNKNIKPFPNPEKFGFIVDESSKVTIGRHVQGMKPSSFSSASTKLPLGATRFKGAPYWIDINKATAAGATFHTPEEIIEDLGRIKAKMKDSADKARIDELIELTRGDKEVLIRNNIPPSAVEGPLTMGLKTSVKAVQVVGFVISAVDMKYAIDDSIEQKSFKPVIKETVKQSGGWAGAWAGMRLGAAVGATVGVETGPGAIITAAAGATVGGFLGYWGGSWVSDHL